jgi:hypothetical protein
MQADQRHHQHVRAGNELADAVVVVELVRRQPPVLVDRGVLPPLVSLAPAKMVAPPSSSPKLKFERQSRSLNEGEVACALSHLAVLLDFCESGARQCLILEDDIEVRDARMETRGFLDAIAGLQWDMIYLSYSHARRRLSRQVRDGIWQLRGQLCSNAYMLNRGSAPELLRAHLGYFVPVDRLYRNVAEAQSFVVLGPDQRIFDQDRRTTGSTLTQARGQLMSPQWSPSQLDKVISRMLAVTSGKHAPGYEERLLHHNQLPNGYLSYIGKRVASIFRRSA